MIGQCDIVLFFWFNSWLTFIVFYYFIFGFYVVYFNSNKKLQAEREREGGILSLGFRTQQGCRPKEKENMKMQGAWLGNTARWSTGFTSESVCSISRWTKQETKKIILNKKIIIKRGLRVRRPKLTTKAWEVDAGHRAPPRDER